MCHICSTAVHVTSKRLYQERLLQYMYSLCNYIYKEVPDLLEMLSGSEAGSYSRLMDVCIAQL